MTGRWIAIAPLLALVACGGEAPQNETAAAPVKPAAFPAGEWEVTSSVESLGSTDKTTPKTSRKEGDSIIRKACVADPKKLEALFTAEGDTCTVQTAFTKNGRINNAYSCRRSGQMLNPTVNGKYTADSFEATVDTATYFSGDGDYQMREKITGKRLGDCPAAAG